MVPSYGLLLTRRRQGTLHADRRRSQSGFFVPGQTRDIQRVRTRARATYTS